MGDEAAIPPPAVDNQRGIVVDLPHTSAAPAMARTHLNKHAAYLPPDLLEDALLLVSELVTNAVLHGQADVVLRVRADPPGIRVSVHDAGNGWPELRGPDSNHHAVGGRGLRIVDAVASSWGVEPSDPLPGKVVWFELHPPPVMSRPT